MRRPVAAAMSGLSVAVAGYGLWSSAASPATPPAVAAVAAAAGVAGVVVDGAVVLAPAPTVTATPPPTTPIPTPTPTPVAKAAGVTVNGSAVGTRYGDVQVQLKVTGGRIVSATALTYPRGSGRDREINSYAIPVLEQATVAAQSAQIDTVSGATFTSEGYLTSLQSALDAAHRAGAL